MRIEKIYGYQQDLYPWIGPFVMNPDVLRINGGYPFKNSEDHVWYLAVEGKNMVKGFIAYANGALCNDFAWQDNEILEQLIVAALRDVPARTEVTFIADRNDRPLLEKLGFMITHERKNYFKMSRRI